MSGVTYVQWGRKQCSALGVQTLYTGVAAGSDYTHSGGVANTQCLPLDPTWGYYRDGHQRASYIYGAEYQLSSSIQPFVNKGSSIFLGIFTSVRNVRWGEGVKPAVRF